MALYTVTDGVSTYHAQDVNQIVNAITGVTSELLNFKGGLTSPTVLTLTFPSASAVNPGELQVKSAWNPGVAIDNTDSGAANRKASLVFRQQGVTIWQFNKGQSTFSDDHLTIANYTGIGGGGGGTVTKWDFATGLLSQFFGINVAGGHLLSSAAGTPTISGVNAGISGTPTVSGNDTCGLLTFTTTATPPAANSGLFTVTYATAYAGPRVPFPLLTETSNQGGAVAVTWKANGPTASAFTVVNGYGALVASVTYTVAYFVMGTG